MRGSHHCLSPSGWAAGARITAVIPTFLLLLATSSRTGHSFHAPSTFSSVVRSTPPASSSSSSTATATAGSPTFPGAFPGAGSALNMARPRAARGLEQRREGLTPTEGGMTLYLKAGPDGTSVGDCPFAHQVRLVLEEKGLPYECRPTPPDEKPSWLLEGYGGKLPALRHRKECYVESSVIVQYLDYFFPTAESDSASASEVEPKATHRKEQVEAAERVLDGFFPAVAAYLKETAAGDGDGTAGGDGGDDALSTLRERLQAVEDHLAGALPDSDGAYLCGDTFTLADCRFTPQLYHLMVAVEGFKGGTPNVAKEYPRLYGYWQRASNRPSFQATVYPKETVLWGWGNARNKQQQ